MSAVPALTIEGLTTHFATRAGTVRAVDNVDLTIPRGKIVGVVGESGSGKSALMASILRLIDPPGRVISGRILLGDRDLSHASEAEMRTIRGRQIAAVFQDPTAALNPVLRIDTQMIETLQAHGTFDRTDALDRSVAALERVGITAPRERLLSYPHQLSGGMRQRIAIAMAMLHTPDVILADEPTTALDVTVQEQILHEVRGLCERTGTSVLWITHDFSVVAALADFICVMYAGQIVERGTSEALLRQPMHPYTQGLLRSIPANHKRGEALFQIPGGGGSVVGRPTGCSFRLRCEHADPACEGELQTMLLPGGRSVRCAHPLNMSAV
jgi:peptide/nickel transport system ATP-binding protein